jgi:hypothetical protein
MSNSKSNSFPRTYKIRHPNGKVTRKTFTSFDQLLKDLKKNPKKIYHSETLEDDTKNTDIDTPR